MVWWWIRECALLLSYLKRGISQVQYLLHCRGSFLGQSIECSLALESHVVCVPPYSISRYFLRSRRIRRRRYNAALRRHRDARKKRLSGAKLSGGAASQSRTWIGRVHVRSKLQLG